MGGAFAAQAVADEGAASTVKATLRIVHLTVELLAHPEHGPAWCVYILHDAIDSHAFRETEQLISLNVGQILAEIQRTSNEATSVRVALRRAWCLIVAQVSASARMVVLGEMRASQKPIVRVCAAESDCVC